MIWTGGVGVKGDEAELRGRAEEEGGLERWVCMNYGHSGQDVLGGFWGWRV